MAFSDLKADVETWTLRTDLPSNIYDLVTEEINEKLRVRQMLSDYSATATAESVTLPTDWLQFDALYVETGGTRIPIFPVSEFSSAVGYRSSGAPLEYVTKNNTLSLNPVPDGSYTLGGEYYARLANLSGDADTNDVLDDFEGIYFAGAMHFAYNFTRNTEEEAKWGQRFYSRIDTANGANEGAKYGGAIRMRGVSA